MPEINVTIPALPEYSADDQWLALATRIIALSGSNNNEAKFLALYKSLPREVQRDYKTLLLSNEDDTYESLVSKLEIKLQMPDHCKFQALHTLEVIGDRSPIQFLQDLRNKYAAAGEINNTNLRFAFALGLPQEYRNIVFTSDINQLDIAATRVNDLWNTNRTLVPSFNPVPQLFQMNNMQLQQNAPKETTSTVKAEHENMQLRQIIEDMNDTIKKMSSRLEEMELKSNSTHSTERKVQNSYTNMPAKRKPFTPRNICPAIPTPQNPHGLCFYHATFGRNARKCAPNCNWTSFKIPHHHCNQQHCLWEKYKTQNQSSSLGN